MHFQGVRWFFSLSNLCSEWRILMDSVGQTIFILMQSALNTWKLPLGLENYNFFSIFSGCHMISTVSVHQPQAIMVRGAPPQPHVTKRLLNLQFLDLTDCCSLEDSGLKIVVENCPQLLYLFMRRCSNISGKDFHKTWTKISFGNFDLRQAPRVLKRFWIFIHMQKSFVTVSLRVTFCVNHINKIDNDMYQKICSPTWLEENLLLKFFFIISKIGHLKSA